MWEYIFDYQQRIALQDDLNIKDLTLLFYFSKNILSQNATEGKNFLYKTFSYKEIINDLQILKVGVKQLKNLISKLLNQNYIQVKKTMPGETTIKLCKKNFEILSPRHTSDIEVEKYFTLSGWKNISNTGNKFPTQTPIYNINNKDNKLNIKLSNELDTTHACAKESSVRSDKIIFFLDVCFNKINELIKMYPEENKNFERLKTILQKSSYEENIAVSKMILTAEDFLEGALDLFRENSNETISEKINNVFEIIDSNKEVKNKYKYSISVIYNMAKGI